ncbi:MAG: mercury resistance system periplasmic binding protein MerP [Rhodospirillaceae bacterium]|nr:mercury resistance system periplasmic binding protein MerP [Rhodospirillaceae bacterium]
MKNLLAAILLATTGASSGALAAERTVTMAVQNMTCAACPYIVQESMSAVDGVEKVIVSFEDKTATVTFDDAKATVAAIADASEHAGYPATLKE